MNWQKARNSTGMTLEEEKKVDNFIIGLGVSAMSPWLVNRNKMFLYDLVDSGVADIIGNDRALRIMKCFDLSSYKVTDEMALQMEYDEAVSVFWSPIDMKMEG